MAQDLKEHMRKTREAAVKCVTHDKLCAVKLSYANGGEPKCHICWKKDPRSEHQISKTTGRVAGGRSSYIPASHKPMYQKAYVDSELVSLREDLATMEAQMMHILAQIRDDPRNAQGFANVLDKTLSAQERRLNKGSLTHYQAYKDLKELIEGQVKYNMLWTEVYQITELKRKLVQTEAKRLSELGWTPEQVYSMIGEIIDLLPPLMTEANLKLFMAGVSSSKLFNGDQLALQDLVSLDTMSIDQQLLLQEINTSHKYVDTEEKDGVYEANP